MTTAQEQQLISDLVTQQLEDHRESAFYYNGNVHTIFLNSNGSYEYSYGEFNEYLDDGGVYDDPIEDLLEALFE